MKKDKSITVGFICSNSNLDNALNDTATREKIDRLIEEYHRKGYRRFISGIDPGYDMVAALAVIEKQKEPGFGDIELLIYLTHIEQNKNHGAKVAEVEDRILKSASNISVTADYGFPGFRYIRDEYIVKDCSVLVYYNEGDDNETENSLEYAEKFKIPRINLEEYEPE